MVKREWILTTVFSLALLGLTACGVSSQNAGQSVQATATPFPPEVMLTDANNGQTVELRTGQTLVISLKGNPTTGYNWGVSDPLPFLQVQGEPEFKPDSSLIGAPGVITLRFKVTGSGNGNLTLAYRRPFETGVAPIQTYSVQVVAR